MRRSRAHLLLCACVGCGPSPASPQPDAGSQHAGSHEGDRAAEDARPADAEASVEPTALAPGLAREVEALGARFRDEKGKPTCDMQAYGELRALREAHGLAAPLPEALEAAFLACEAVEDLAELMQQRLTASSSIDERLAAGAAWLRAKDYDKAIALLVPAAEELGVDTQAGWLAGFALFHAGRVDEARPWLEGGRAHAGGSDAFVLCGLAKLDEGDTEGAIAELEAGLAGHPDNRSLLAALARAYTTVGRTEEAAEMSARARAAYAANEKAEREAARLGGLNQALSEAWDLGEYAEVEGIIDEMWPLAPQHVRTQLLGVRVRLYDKLGRPEDAAAAKAELAAIPAQGAKP